MKQRIYIAGPYSNGSPEENTLNAIETGNRILDLGFAPYIPHLTHFWHLITPKDYEVWMELDLKYVEVCDGLYRMAGESKGADREVAFATARNIPVFYSLDTLKAYQWHS